MAEAIITEFVQRTESAIESLTRQLVGGGCNSYEDYRAKCAEIHAYRRSIDNFRQVVAKHQGPDSEEGG